MNLRKAPISIFLLFSIALFSQKSVESKAIVKIESNNLYLDSVKKSFVKHDKASRLDSLWMKELTDLDLYNDISGDIKNINIDEKVDYELPTELLKQRLAAMDAKSPFRIEYNVGLENVIKSFLKNRKKSYERLMAISEYYFPLFEESFAKQNVPLEIKYLAIVESALNPKAVSKMGATGLWQFMYQTGKQYDLKIDSYVDERSDPLKASAAAAQYMSNMFAIFGDWNLVLASYNSGPGNVTKAIRRSGGQQNFWNIRKFLPQETQGYVPAFLATMYLYEYHKEHGIVPNRAVIKQFTTDTLMIKKEMSFKQISDLLDIPVSQLQLLNPSYKLNIIPFYTDQSHYLRLPKDKIAVFTSNEEKIYAYLQHELDLSDRFYQSKAIVAVDSLNFQQKIAHSKPKYYKVKKGDNLNSIAKKYDLSITDIKKWNGLKSNSVALGRNLKISTDNPELAETSKKETKTTGIVKNDKQVVVSDSKNNQEEKTKKEIKTDVVSEYNYYTVQKGDNLASIAKKNNVSLAEIQEWNQLNNVSIPLGMSLKVAKKEVTVSETVAEAPKIENVEYIVKKGDNLGTISKKYGSSIDDLKIWNNLKDNNIALGTSLIVAQNELITASASTTKKTAVVAVASKKNSQDYFVQKGDSLYSISKKYPGVTISDIKKWNNINNQELKPGMKLKING